MNRITSPFLSIMAICCLVAFSALVAPGLKAETNETKNESTGVNKALEDTSELSAIDQVCIEDRSMRRRFKRIDDKLGLIEVGIAGGTAHSITDIQGNKGLGFSDTFKSLYEDSGYNIGAFFNYRLVNNFGIGAAINYINLSGASIDSIAPGISPLSFENNIFEFNGRLSFYLPLSSLRVFDLYGFIGLSVFYNSLEVLDDNQLPFAMDEFHSIQLALPFGVGFSFRLGENFSVGLETGYRYTPFNYLDGFSLPASKYDSFLLTQVKLGFFID